MQWKRGKDAEVEEQEEEEDKMAGNSDSSLKVTVKNDRFERNSRDNTTKATSTKSIGIRELRTGVEVEVSNLQNTVEKEDIAVLFGRNGKVKSVTMELDSHGKGTGRAFVMMDSKDGAYAAVREYDGVKLDGKPMTIRVIGGSKTISDVVKESKKVVESSKGSTRERKPEREDGQVTSGGGSSTVAINSNTGGIASHFLPYVSRGRGRGYSRGGRRGGVRRGRRGESRTPTSLNALDADLDAYMSK